MKTVLTIAGSDCSGGAGIQADIKTIAAHGLYATSVITALTAQNTTGVYGVEEVSPDFVAKQLDCVFMDIPPDSVKIGMVSGEKTIQAIAAKLRQYGAKHVVMDPVMVSTSGTRLLSEAGREALLKELLPLVALVTPNLPEAQVLSGLPVETEGDMLRAAREISRLCRGGGSHQGRTFVWGCRRSSVPGGEGGVAPDPADFQSQHPRNRLHPVFRHCLRPGGGLPAGGERPACQSVPHRRVIRRIGLGPGVGAAGPYLPHAARW